MIITKHFRTLALYMMAIVAVSCGDQPKAGQTGAASKVKEYPVITVKTQTTRLFKDYPTKLQGQQTVEIRSKIAGYIEQIFVDEGAFVRKGQVLFRLNATDIEATVRSAEAFVKVAEALQQNCLVIWGSPEEQAKAEWMAQQTDTIKVLPRLDLNSLKALIAKADLLIGNDTGPTHMAWGLNIPSITLFGPTPVSRVYQTDINKVLKSPSVVNPFKLNKQDFSIQEIDENEVIQLAESLLQY